MKTFIAYRFTGEDPTKLEPLLTVVRDTFQRRNVEAHCTFFDEVEFKDKSYNARQIMEHAFRIIDESDFLFVLITSDNKSEGMLVEVGYCIAKGIPIVVAVKEAVNYTYLPDMAEVCLRWKKIDELAAAIQDLNMDEIKSLPRF